MKITKHADKRIRKRLGLKRKAVARRAAQAIANGKRREMFTGSLRRYLDKLFFNYGGKNELIVYHNMIFIMHGSTSSQALLCRRNIERRMMNETPRPIQRDNGIQHGAGKIRPRKDSGLLRNRAVLPSFDKREEAAHSALAGYNEAQRLLREGVDIITAGFPCQDISTAGKQMGIQFDQSTGEAFTRSGLFGQVIRAVRLVRPKYVILENVAAIFNGYLGDILRHLAESGYDTQWDCLSSGRLGRGHLRERFYAVAYPHGIGLQGSKQRMPKDKRARNIHAALLPALPLREATPENNLSKPYVVGGADGIPHRSHRIKVLGNAVDPEIIEHIGRQIKEGISKE